jgi:tagatose 6-phosphate kinase
MKIGIVNLNFTIDRIHLIDNFSEGEVFRPGKTFAYGGGKGVNVARVLKTLGIKSEIMGFLGSWTGKFIKSTLDREKLLITPVEVSGESRISTIVVNPVNRRQTVINEQGPVINRKEIKNLVKGYKRFIKDKNIIVISGSMPRGIPKNFYGKLVKIAKDKGIPVFLDTSRKALLEGLKSKPLIVKPNLAELQELIGYKLYSLKDISKAIKKINEYGPEIVIVSLGERGAMMSCNNKVWLAVPPGVKVVNAISSGDALAAGFVYIWTKSGNEKLEYALQFAVACGTATALTERTGHFRKDDLARILPKVKIKP